MARTVLTKKALLGPYGDYSVAQSATLTNLTAADVANKNMFVAGSSDLIVAINTGGSPYTVSVTSVADAFGRTKDIATYSLAAAEIALIQIAPPGWKQSDGNIYLEASNVAVKFAIVPLM